MKLLFDIGQMGIFKTVFKWPCKIQLLKNLFFKTLANQRAQVIVEYILLLVVSTAIALLLINLVTVDPNKGSPVFKYWENLLKVLGQDIST